MPKVLPAFDRLWDALPDHAHDDKFDWDQFDIPRRAINIARRIVVLHGLEALENMLDDDVRLPPLGAVSIAPGFVSAWALLVAPDQAFTKLTISHLRHAYQFTDEDGTSTWWLYGAKLPEIEMIARVVEWRLTPDGLEAVIEDRYGREITATWSTDSYPVLAPPAQ
ncbi:uncharacterized protein B0H18DRAFT_1132261 [Fomitopsis serialis]|uniref:uncharacterized protein n=1 Tax=Fomitopsis serialis TaxID=139415 RepID=UPI0020083D98|nr:uncharacterized protein B0H18DRAFT_1132261 [Neoantrodia serialis]KAH9904635.1 hypothetical protein B0H18DRAFT_1132261 [Neoantrodia serialis]